MGIKVGHIFRREDESGISGTGRVAEWVEYSDGEVVVHWLSHTPSTNHYRNMKQVDAVHGHSGKTEIVVDWEEPKLDPSEEIVDEELAEKSKTRSKNTGKDRATASLKTSRKKPEKRSPTSPSVNSPIEENGK